MLLETLVNYRLEIRAALKELEADPESCGCKKATYVLVIERLNFIIDFINLYKK